MSTSLQNRTSEFHLLASNQRKRLRQPAPANQPLLPANDGRKPARSEFASRALQIGRQITSTMSKLERLATLASRKALFDDKPVEIAELTYVIKQDLSSINAQISSLQQFVRGGKSGGQEEEQHSKNVVVMLQGKLADVSVGFKEVLETRTKNIQASRARTEKFVSGVRPASPADGARGGSPLYTQGAASAALRNSGSGGETLSLEPANPLGSQQLALLEEGQTGSSSYIAARGEAIEAIERTISELGGIFGQLAQMVSEQSEQIQRIDHDTDDIVANVEGGQRELLKYWARVSSNRWLVVKMFGVLMIFFLVWVLVS